MPPHKKKDKDSLSTSRTISSPSSNIVANADTNRLIGHHQEQELFLQAFEKPTQIYRYLRNRHDTNPIFMNRTLSYMKHRMSRSHKSRSFFKLDCLLDLKNNIKPVPHKYLSVIYNGLCDGNIDSENWCEVGDAINVECILYRIIISKRKETTSDFQPIWTCTSNVCHILNEEMRQHAVINIPMQSICLQTDQHTIYKLVFRIQLSSDKAYRLSHNKDCEDMKKKLNKTHAKFYGCNLTIFGKGSWTRPGDYECVLQEMKSSIIKSYSPKQRTWETLPPNHYLFQDKFDIFDKVPTLKYRLIWSNAELPDFIDSADMFKYVSVSGLSRCQTAYGNSRKNFKCKEGIDSGPVNLNNNCLKDDINRSGNFDKTEKFQIVYNFLCNNNTCQQTEYTEDMQCPWCSIDCLKLIALLKHLKHCHARFNFTYTPTTTGARIDVTINDSYDGSYGGSPYDLASPSSASYSRRSGPRRLTPVTNLLVCRPRRQKTCLAEFMVLDEDDLNNPRPYITGHNRLYHHTETCLPVHPKELDEDSEGESDPVWLRQKTVQMIDEFSDVNEGEKELMKFWNLHVLKDGYVGDCQLPFACETFLRDKGLDIVYKNLYRNFILHMCSLFDYGLVSPEAVYKSVQKLQGILSKDLKGQEMMSKQRDVQLKYWLEVGRHKQEEQKLKSPHKNHPSSNTLPGDGNSFLNSIKKENKDINCTTSKRSANSVMRFSMHTKSGPSLTTSNNLPISFPSKAVAKKTASQVDDQILSKETNAENGLKRRLGTGNIKEELKEEPKEELSIRVAEGNQAIKRKNLQKDILTTKRNRTDSMATSDAATGSSTRSLITLSNTTCQPFTTNVSLPRRVVTRRQSIPGNIHISSQEIESSKNERNMVKNKSHYSTRNRASLPVTKIDKQ